MARIRRRSVPRPTMQTPRWVLEPVDMRSTCGGHAVDTRSCGRTPRPTPPSPLTRASHVILRQVNKILLLVAMEAEAMPMVSSLSLTKTENLIAPPAPCVTYVSDDGNICLTYYGKCPNTGMCAVGTAPAALYTYLALQAFEPDLVISTGTAGGFKSRNAAIGDVFIASKTVNHDRRIAIPGFDEYGVGKLGCVTAPRMRRDLGLKVGVCSSGNSLDWHDMDMTVMQTHEAAVKEMEAASVAWAASMFGVPLLAVKAITDIVDGDHPPHEEFLRNLAAAAEALQDVVPKVVRYIHGRRIGELYEV